MKITFALRVGGSVLVLGALGFAQVTQRVSVSSSGVEGNGTCRRITSISAGGRFVAFASAATNMVAGDSNGVLDVFVRDRTTGVTERVSVGSGGAQANGASQDPSISGDGRYVAFQSSASNLVASDTNGRADIFVRDRVLLTTERVSIDSSGAEGNLDSFLPAISTTGRYVAFGSSASNLVVGDTNGFQDVFVRDRQSATTERVSIDSAAVEGNSTSSDPYISADGRFVAFVSSATNLVAGDTNTFLDVFVHDRSGDTTERVSVDSSGVEGNADSSALDRPTISADGRYVAFASQATNLVASDTNSSVDVFLHDRQSDTTERVNLDSGGLEGDDYGAYPSISADGRLVAFASPATNLVPGDTNGSVDIFVRDRQTATTERASVNWAGVEGNALSSPFPAISGNGRYVVFHSFATNLVPADTNGTTDIFVRDRVGVSVFTSLCDPGLGGVQSCPCGNPPSGSGRGCDNSAATGGAILSATGAAYLSSDSLVFTTSGERPSALSILMQGTASPPAGLIYGQGIRCASGLITRLYQKVAVGGTITAPDFAVGNPSVSVRSAAKGDVIGAGQSRWYLVFYRDSTVLGGCPPTSTYNATQTGLVVWSP